MKTTEIKLLFDQFEAAAHGLNGVECWSARELQKLLGYALWQNFEKVLAKAKMLAKMLARRSKTILLMSIRWSKLALAQKKR